MVYDPMIQTRPCVAWQTWKYYSFLIDHTKKYTCLKKYLIDRGYSVNMVLIDERSKGHVTKSNIHNLIDVFVKSNAIKLCKTLGKISLLCTFAICHAYHQPTWVCGKRKLPCFWAIVCDMFCYLFDQNKCVFMNSKWKKYLLTCLFPIPSPNSQFPVPIPIPLGI
jgi:hypothetical protein